MRFSYYLNITCFFLFILSLFISQVIALLFLMLLGWVQVITGLYYVTKRNVINLKNQKLITVYFIMIFGFFILSAFTSNLPNNLKIIIEFLAPFTVFIPIYFLFVCHSFFKESIVQKDKF